MKTTAQKHLDAIASGTIERTNIIGIRKALSHVDRIRAGWSGNRSRVTPAEADDLEQALDRYRPRVAGELHDTGLRVLRSPRYGKRFAPLADSIAALDYFRLLRFDRVNYGMGDVIAPVYAVWAKIPPKGDALDGGTYEAFRFRLVSWQSGGDGPEVVS